MFADILWCSMDPLLILNIILQNNDEKVPVAQYVKNVMNWNCTKDHSNMVILRSRLWKKIFINTSY